MRVTNNMMLRNTTSNINNNKYSVNSLNCLLYTSDAADE